jgi:iron complex transport system substrate-binding protein
LCLFWTLGLIVFPAGGCDRTSSSHPSTLHGPVRSSTDSAKSVGTTPQTDRPVILRDWPAEPEVDPSEREAPDLRIVAGAPSVTEICCALGLRDRLVARTRFCNHPPGVEQVPAFGALVDTNIELLLERKPDLILLSGHSRMLFDRLAPLGVRLESVPDGSAEDVFRAIEQIGRLTGRPKTAQRLVESLRRELKEVAEAFRGSPARRVLILTGTLSSPPSPPFVAGPGSFYDDALRLVGHRNAAPADGPAYGMLSLESILKADPEVIIELDAVGLARPGGDAEALAAWSAVGPLQAVAGGRVHVVVGPHCFVPGPRIAQTFYAICRAIARSQHE